MATFGTPSEAKDNVIGPAIYTTSTKIGLYTNTANSFSAGSTLSEVTEPTGTGYARITLSGTWSFNDGVVTYSPNVQFQNTDASASWSSAVTGSFMVDGTETYLLHFKDRASGSLTMTAGKVLEIDISALLD